MSSVLSYLVMFASLGLLGVYGYEIQVSGRYYLEYKTVVPVLDHYKRGQDILFLSFAYSKHRVKTDWNEVVYCASDQNNEFFTHATYKSSSASYYQPHVYPQSVISILETDPSTFEAVTELRRYAREIPLRPWRLGVTVPHGSGTCVVKHEITVYTPRFRIPKLDVIVSNPWTYGPSEGQ